MEWILMVLYLLMMTIVVVRLIRGRFGRERTVTAEVVGKQTVEWASKNSPRGKTLRYVVVFQVEGKKKSFYVNEFSYGGYRKGEKGKLTYRGDRLIDFH